MKDTSVASVVIVPEVLTFDNYDRWSVFIKNYLIGKGLWGVVIGDDDTDHFNKIRDIEQGLSDSWESVSEVKHRYQVSWRKKNAKALHIIQVSCARQIQDELFHFEIASDAWDHLSTRYDKILKIIVDEVQQDDDGLSVEHKKLFRMVKRGDSIEETKVDPNVYDVIVTSDSERTLLHIAVNAGNIKNVEILVREGGDKFVTKKDKHGDTALSLAACYNAEMKIVETLVDSKTGKMLLMEPNEKGEIPVHLAAGKGRKEMTSYLYSKTSVEVFNEDSRNRVLLLDRCMEAEIFDVALRLLKLYPDNLFNEAFYGNTNNNEDLLQVSKFSAIVSFAKLQTTFEFKRYHWVHICIYICLSMKQFEDKYEIPQSDIMKFTRTLMLSYHDRSLHMPPYLLPLIKFLGRLLRRFLYLLVNQLFWYLNIFGTRGLYDLKFRHYQIRGTLKYLIQNIEGFNGLGLRQGSAQEAMLYAAQNGAYGFINAMRKAIPDLLSVTDNNGRGIFWYAIQNRRRNLFKLVYFLNEMEKDMFRYHTDSFGNNLLHIAALLVPSSNRSSLWGPAMQIQRELQWFKAVEDILPPMCKIAKNGDGKKPFDVFIESHEELVKAGEQWTKDTARTYIAVDSLVLTIMFAAAFAIPHADNQQAILLDEKIFNMFLIADVASIFASASSVLVFIKILTSRYSAIDFFKAMPLNLVLGLVLLLLSVCSMMVAFYAALDMILKQNHIHSRWVVLGPIMALGSFPVLILLISQLSFIYGVLLFTMKNPISSIRSFL